ncbi:hypothetical protein ZHAS_00012317 [Anopheles sinensis]|uniref:Uncharacterized protein n=2 Tax=Anopheles sinensis TaxID=74873 RepID=A0A084W2D1_ANOSI|nr:hypothetical protein ZHAS_00012317 [Anopheles sinensis]
MPAVSKPSSGSSDAASHPAPSDSMEEEPAGGGVTRGPTSDTDRTDSLADDHQIRRRHIDANVAEGPSHSNNHSTP